jgi:hypothetical protein
MQQTEDIGEIHWSRLDATVPTASVLAAAIDRVGERAHDASHGAAGEAQ